MSSGASAQADGREAWFDVGPPGTAALRDVDRKYRRLQRWCSHLQHTWWISTVLVIAVVVGATLSGYIDLDGVDTQSTAGTAIGAASGLAAIAASLFLITAQLRVAGISRRGLVELHHVRQMLPLATSATLGAGAGICAIVVAEHESTLDEALACIALLMLIPLAVAVVQLLLISLVYFEPIVIAEQFAEELRAEHVYEWRLFTLQVRVPAANSSGERIAVRCNVHSNRMNFGLRDPLMPIQELVQNAKGKEFGRLGSTLISRIARDYGIPWEEQAPDADEWLDEFPAHGSRAYSAPDEPERAAHRRLSLLLLVLHYLRRLPLNNNVVGVPPDARRQQTQFLLSRLAFLLARTNAADTVSEAEQRTALTLVLYALLGISESFRFTPAQNNVEPPAALLEVAVALRERGWQDEYLLCVRGIRWLAANTTHVRNLWRGEYTSERRPVLVQVRRGVLLTSYQYPVLPDVEDPWSNFHRFEQEGRHAGPVRFGIPLSKLIDRVSFLCR